MNKNSLTIVILLLLNAGQIALSQTAIVVQSTTGNYYGTLDFSLANPPQAVGIGNFTTYPASALHVNTNTTMGTSWYNAGEVFRTDAPNAATYWRMLRGGAEFGKIYNDNDNHFYIQATNASGDLRFNSGGSSTNMTITSGGNVGIGVTTPSQKLTVTGGNIDVNTGTNGYMINNAMVLQHKNNTANIFVGVGAGTSATGSNNTFVGNNAGNDASNSGGSNTFLGTSTGFKNTAGASNTFTGFEAGYSNLGGNYNTFSGYHAGYLSNADYNTFTGYKAGENNTTGSHNCFYGKKSGQQNNQGNGNTFYGDHSGWHANQTSPYNLANYNVFMGDATGDNFYRGDSNVVLGTHAGLAFGNGTAHHGNVFIGAYAAQGATGHDDILIGVNADANTGVKNGVAIGATAKVMNSSQMILGDNNMKVGIGLSGDATGPRSKLEINDGTAGKSGLQFTQLTSATIPASNPGAGVLAVDNTGKVIYVPDNVGSVGTCGTPLQDYITKFCPSTNDVERSIMFEDATRRIGISITTGLQGKLHVNNATEVVSAFANNTLGGTRNYGVLSHTGSASPVNISLWGLSSPTFPPLPVPVPQLAILGINAAVPYNAGVVGQATGANFNFGGIFQAYGCSHLTPDINIGIYASSQSCFGAGNLCAGYFQGLGFSTIGFFPASDAKLKDSIVNISNALSIISTLQPKNYVFKTDSFPYMQLPEGRHYGFIAQQIDTIMPDIVATVTQPPLIDSAGTLLQDTMSFKALNYNDFIPLAIAGIQELDAAKVSSDSLNTDSNRVVKWSTTNRTLTKSQIYDGGGRVGIPRVANGNYFHIENNTDSVAAHVESQTINTTAVVKAEYSMNNADHTVYGVRGYSKYTNNLGARDGIGGYFEGGKQGVYGHAGGNDFILTGVYGEAVADSSSVSIGVAGLSASTNTGNPNIGLLGQAGNSDQTNFGVLGSSQMSSSTQNIAIHGVASGSTFQNIGGNFDVYDTIGVNYGVYSSVSGSAPNYYAGMFNGDVHVNGALTYTSDGMLKKDIKPFSRDSALSAIMRLEPKTYTFNNDQYPYLSLAQGKQYGFIAQDVEAVLPELVSEIIHPARVDKDGKEISPRLEYKGLNYIELIPLLVGAVKEQQSKIDSLSSVINNRLNDLEDRLNGCCGVGNSNKTDGNGNSPDMANRLTVELSSTQVIILEQNVPNPFAEQTSIQYFIPENITNAQMIFTDMLGNTIKTAEVKSGYGVVTVFASNLTTGQYSYSLVIDGKVVESKRMVKTK